MHFDVPVAAYRVSGEYSMISSASATVDRKAVIMESLYAIRRAGAFNSYLFCGGGSQIYSNK